MAAPGRDTDLEVGRRSLSIRAATGETLVDDSVSALAVQLDLAARRPDDRRHALPGRIEFADVEDLILLVPPEDVDEDRSRLACVEAETEQLGARHECSLVWTRCLVDNLAVLDLGDDGVADGEEGDEFAHDVGLAALVVTKPTAKFFKGLLTADVNAVGPTLAPLGVLDDVSVLDASDRALAELHLVARKRTGLVREDVLNLPKFLYERGRATERRCIRLGVVPVGKGPAPGISCCGRRVCRRRTAQQTFPGLS